MQSSSRLETPHCTEWNKKEYLYLYLFSLFPGILQVLSSQKTTNLKTWLYHHGQQPDGRYGAVQNILVSEAILTIDA
ncbi:hypothetical protein BgiMline_036289 [Biomphalaria glabrata]